MVILEERKGYVQKVGVGHNHPDRHGGGLDRSFRELCSFAKKGGLGVRCSSGHHAS
jgi:hypothetical protein